MTNNTIMANNTMANNIKDCYILKIYIDRTIIRCEETISKYTDKVRLIQNKFESSTDIESGEIMEFDAGFDLFVPDNYNIYSKIISTKINHGIHCSMSFNNKPTAYYLYPRSSMGAKTPLRLSNSVGIIDAGYRGPIIGLVDNISEENYEVSPNDRLMQICGPNIMYPIYPVIVNSIEELGITIRGAGGFGSTGK